MARRHEPPTLAGAVVNRTHRGVVEVFIGKAPAGPYATRWAFPSGPVEEGESAEEALRRILRHVLDMQVRIVFGQPPFDHRWDDVLCRWRFYFCEDAGGRVHNSYFSETRWVTRADLREYEFDPVSQRIVDWMLEEPA